GVPLYAGVLARHPAPDGLLVQFAMVSGIWRGRMELARSPVNHPGAADGGPADTGAARGHGEDTRPALRDDRARTRRRRVRDPLAPRAPACAAPGRYPRRLADWRPAWWCRDHREGVRPTGAGHRDLGRGADPRRAGG